MKIQSPWMGRVRGSAGNMTGCKVYDKNVMRAKAFEVSNPNTAAQQNQRTFFAELTALCSDFDEALLRTLFPQKPKSMSRRNAITKQIAENTTTDNGQKVINFETIDTLGNASVMNFGAEIEEYLTRGVNVRLSENVVNDQAFSQNYFFCALVSPHYKEIYFSPTFDKVQEEYLEITYPSHWENGFDVIPIPFITDSLTSPTSFGDVKVIKRPPHANS